MPHPKPVTGSTPTNVRREPEREESTAVRRYGAAMAIEFEDADAVPNAIADAQLLARTHDEAVEAIAVSMRTPLSSLMLTSALLLQHTNTDPGTAHLRRYVESLQRSADQLEMGLRVLIERAAQHAEHTAPAAHETHAPAVGQTRAGVRTLPSAVGVPETSAPRAASNRATRQRVLIVDDDLETLAGMREALERNGFDVLTATSGASALSLSETWAPDMIIVDLCLPGMDGEQICREFRRQRGRAAPIVMVSASTRLEETCRALGLEHYLRKPFEVNDLVAKLACATATEPAPALKTTDASGPG